MLESVTFFQTSSPACAMRMPNRRAQVQHGLPEKPLVRQPDAAVPIASWTKIGSGLVNGRDPMSIHKCFGENRWSRICCSWEMSKSLKPTDKTRPCPCRSSRRCHGAKCLSAHRVHCASRSRNIPKIRPTNIFGAKPKFGDVLVVFGKIRRASQRRRPRRAAFWRIEWYARN